MSADFNGRELSHLSDFDSPLDRIHREDHSELVKGSQSGLYTEEFKWIRRQLRVKLSEYSNDTMFHSVLMSRFYHKYSASQDYYYSNIVNNILSDTQTAPAIRWQDVQTELDDDEYLKRFYQVNEYDHKIKLLSEYYKFHKDIPRFFAQPTCRKLNEYHEKKRKIDYHRIKQILIEEAQKKNKRVAMNDDDNEIRLTDRDIEQSEGKDGQRNDNDADDNSESDSEDRRNPVTDQKMLPDYLIHSLYKDEQKRKRERERANARKNSAQKEDQSNSSIKDLHEKLKMIGQHIDESSIISGFDCENSRWEPKIDFGRKGEGFHPELAISKIDSSRQNGHKQSKTVCMQMLDEKAKNIKDVNLNINLNLRVLGDKNTCSSEYDCFIPRGLILKGSKDKLGSGLKPSTEFKRLAKNKKLFNSGIRCQFKKKNKPDELRVSSKDLSTESRVIRRANMRSHGRCIDSENSLSQRKLPPGHLPVASMQIQNSQSSSQ